MNARNLETFVFILKIENLFSLSFKTNITVYNKNKVDIIQEAFILALYCLFDVYVVIVKLTKYRV
jgi:hypothetical protein